MKKKFLVPIILCASWLPIHAQNSNEVEQLRQQLQQVKNAFEKSQAESRRQIDELTRRLDEVLKNVPPAARRAEPVSEQKTPASTNGVTRQDAGGTLRTPEQLALEKQLAAELGGSASTNALRVGDSQNSLLQSGQTPSPIPLLRTGQAYMNISFDALLDFGWSSATDPSDELQLGGHDPSSRGFTLPNAEIALDGAVDPYFKGFANIVLKLDNEGETEIELEEAFGQTTSLPGNLQLKAGQFFAAFGRQNAQHPHQWAFADQPLILNRTMGPDGLRNVGAQLSWLAPLPVFTEASVGIFNGEGETTTSFRFAGDDDGTGVDRYLGRATRKRDLRGIGDLLYVPRLASSFDLTDEQTLVAGVSGAFGPNNTGAHTRTEVFGADLYWKWKPANARQGFPFVSWQSEVLYRRYEAATDATVPLPSETIRDYGFYSQVLWGFRPRWITGLRGEWVAGNDSMVDRSEVVRGDRTRISPALTWFPSEFSKLRLQYNYDQGQHFGDEHSIWLQLEFLLGAHGAHQF